MNYPAVDAMLKDWRMWFIALSVLLALLELARVSIPWLLHIFRFHFLLLGVAVITIWWLH